MKQLFLVLFLLSCADRAIACSCAFPESSLEEAVTASYQSAKSVVLATAQRVENLDPEVADVWSPDKGHHTETLYNLQRTHFETKTSWKGEHGDRFSTEIVITCCLCGYSFEEGETYLVYLYGPDENGHFATNDCSRTKLESAISERELEILNKLQKSEGHTDQPNFALQRKTPAGAGISAEFGR